MGEDDPPPAMEGTAKLFVRVVATPANAAPALRVDAPEEPTKVRSRPAGAVRGRFRFVPSNAYSRSPAVNARAFALRREGPSRGTRDATTAFERVPSSARDPSTRGPTDPT